MTQALKTLLKKAALTPMPEQVQPMLCTLTREPVVNENYVYEVKLDGYRIVASRTNHSVKLASRGGLDYTAKYPPLSKALRELKHEVVLDGEAVVLNKAGNADFDALQKFNGHSTPIAYYVFDILWIDGYNVMERPLLERKTILQAVLKDNKVLRYTEHTADGVQLYKKIQETGQEGIIAKRKDSAYIPGDRSSNWYKTPTMIRQEFVIGGWAESDKARSFKSLLFGAYNKQQKLEWIGRSGSGYKEKDMPAILKTLQQIEIDKSPFVNPVLDIKGAKLHYVKPMLVANFSFATWTKSGRIRKPATFLGFRKDKKPAQVVREVPQETASVETAAPVKKKRRRLPAQPGSHWPAIEKTPISSEENFDIEGCTIALSNVERELWKGIHKAALIQYYHAVAPVMLPYLRNRPQSLLLKPVNAQAPGIYIKDMEGRQPACSSIFHDKRKHPKAGRHSTIDYLVCNNEATLLYMVNLGCIDIHPWTSRISSPETPDFIVIDLDPSDDDFGKVIKAALAAKTVLSKLRLTSFAKTSGQTGLHIYIPCRGFSFPQARKLAEQLCRQIQALAPDISTTEISVDHRGTKLYLDPNQNDYADTVAAPYSVRPYHTPRVSCPVEWREINARLNPGDFTIHTMQKRLDEKGDIFKDALNEKVAAANTKRLQQYIGDVSRD